MPACERLELGHEVGVKTQRELGLKLLLDRCQVELLQAHDLVLRELVEGEVGKWAPVPERERSAEALNRSAGVSLGLQCAALGKERLEAVTVELARSHAERVAAANRPQRLDACGENLSERRDAALKRLRGRPGRFRPPE